MIDGKDDLGDAAKTIERNISEALKQMVPYKACIADLRAQKYDAAVKDASLAITAYPNTSFGPYLSAPSGVEQLNLPDSVIGVANAILSRGFREHAGVGESRRCVFEEGRQGQGDRDEPSHLSSRPDQHDGCDVDRERPCVVRRA